MGLKSHSNFSGGVLGAGGFHSKPGFGPVSYHARPGSTDCPGARIVWDRGCSDWGANRVQDSNLELHYK